MTKDIEREAFLEHWRENNLPYDGDDADEEMCFEYWQAAKAHEAKKLEGCVVVPVEPTPKMIDSTWDYQDEIDNMSHNSRNAFIYKNMIRVAIEEAARGGK